MRSRETTPIDQAKVTVTGESVAKRGARENLEIGTAGLIRQTICLAIKREGIEIGAFEAYACHNANTAGEIERVHYVTCRDFLNQVVVRGIYSEATEACEDAGIGVEKSPYVLVIRVRPQLVGAAVVVAVRKAVGELAEWHGPIGGEVDDISIVEFVRVAEVAAELDIGQMRANVVALGHRSRELKVHLSG